MTQSRTIQVFVLSTGQVLAGVASLAATVALVRLLPLNEYAIYRQTTLSYQFALPFALLGLDRALFHFMPTDGDRQRGALTENLLLLAAAGLLLSLFLFFGGNVLLSGRFQNPELTKTLSAFVLYPAIALPALAVPSCLLASGHATRAAAFNASNRLLFFLAVVTPAYIFHTAASAIYGMVFSALATLIMAVPLMYRCCSVGPARPTLEGLKRQLAFSIPLGAATLVGSLSASIDQLLVAINCDSAAFAIFTVGAIELPLIGIVTGAITSVVLVDYARLYHAKRTPDIVKLIHKAMIHSAVVLLPAMALLLCIAPAIMELLFGKTYSSSAHVFRTYLLLLPIRCLTFGAVLQASGRSRSILVSAVLSLVANVFLSYIFIGIYGAVGAAIATVLTSYIVEVPFLIACIALTLHVSIKDLLPWRQLAILTSTVLMPAIFTVAITALPEATPTIQILSGTMTFSATLLVIWWRSGLFLEELLEPLRGISSFCLGERT